MISLEYGDCASGRTGLALNGTEVGICKMIRMNWFSGIDTNVLSCESFEKRWIR
jgi:hypothetical protein